jgi:signal transduction histidine kinase/CheY-like chemotaxis protein
MAAAAAALPLSPALANLIEPDSSRAAIALACGFASALAALLALWLHRRWSAAARASIEQADRIRLLEAARDAAIKADQEKSRFLAIASHDLRQPVHAIGLFAATLEKRLEGSAEEPLVRNMSRAIDGLDRSFNVMLDISRLDAGAIEPRVQQFPLRDLFRRLHMHFAGQAEQKGLGLRFSPGGKSISSDPQLLERILGNLVQNAIKYTERGGIVVVARSTESHINVEIWDTGVGIRGADLRKVFDEFFQVGRGERVRTQGLGMGLAIVKRLVRLLGHELIVASKPGRGTMFRLRIALSGLPDLQDVTAGADTLPMPLLQPRTVLVLDDEEAIREGLCGLLQEWGYDAIAAGSIAQAERAVSLMDTPPDMILSDLHLGDGPDGIAGIEAIRRQCGCDVAAMLITGDTSHEEIRRATESGYPVLFKPVQPRKLYDALRGLAS